MIRVCAFSDRALAMATHCCSPVRNRSTGVVASRSHRTAPAAPSSRGACVCGRAGRSGYAAHDRGTRPPPRKAPARRTRRRRRRAPGGSSRHRPAARRPGGRPGPAPRRSGSPPPRRATSPERTFIRVDLPAPFSPRSACTSLAPKCVKAYAASVRKRTKQDRTPSGSAKTYARARQSRLLARGKLHHPRKLPFRREQLRPHRTHREVVVELLLHPQRNPFDLLEAARTQNSTASNYSQQNYSRRD